jgi:hypothetical protein
VSGIEAIRNMQRRRARRRVYLTDIHALMNPPSSCRSLGRERSNYAHYIAPSAN